MRYASKKRQKLNRMVAKDRGVDFPGQFSFCWYCGTTSDLGVNEMISGSGGRVVGLQHRLCWTRACGRCNCQEATNYRKWPLERQLALKFIHDRPHFDLEKFNVLRGRAPGAITMADVIPWICRFLDGWRIAA